MMSEIITLNQVSLWRRTQEEFNYDFKKTILTFLEGKYVKPKKKRVLNNINLTIEKGEKVGIIGANGAGKSTLLKVICGILNPTQGKVNVQGNIAPLIELGAGFNQDMTVEDNIILYGVLLGYNRQEIKKRTSSILAFAELSDYAQMPVKGLSSGMKARLGFAVATDIHPDILILDEVLSVGDARFTQKSRQRIDQLWQDNSTILFVSHSLESIQELCTKTIWLENGTIKYLGETDQAIQLYLDTVRL